MINALWWFEPECLTKVVPQVGTLTECTDEIFNKTSSKNYQFVYSILRIVGFITLINVLFSLDEHLDNGSAWEVEIRGACLQAVEVGWNLLNTYLILLNPSLTISNTRYFFRDTKRAALFLLAPSVLTKKTSTTIAAASSAFSMQLPSIPCLHNFSYWWSACVCFKVTAANQWTR